MRLGLAVAALVPLLFPAIALGGEAADALADHLYAGTAAQGLAAATEGCSRNDAEACFARGIIQLVTAYEGLAQDLYRHGATVPGTAPAALLFGIEDGFDTAPANPNPEPLSYTGLRSLLGDFLADVDQARLSFERAGNGGDYVVSLEPMRVRLDLDGDGTAGEGENLGALLGGLWESDDIPAPDAPPPGNKTKTKRDQAATTRFTIGFDRADAIWFAGYMQITAAPVDLVLAHDFSGFFGAFLHRVFPKAGLPMENYSRGGTLLMDPESDTNIADFIAAIHTLDFPVTEPARLAGVLDRLREITRLSRRNWELILAETDDNRELVPSPRQTSLAPDMPVTQPVVDAWLATLETVDQVLAGELLVPHWRFRQGFDLKHYFETATETDLVMILTGSGALPYLKDGPIADAAAFSQANEVLGTNWLGYAFWFN
ncbi:hypothetical protein [Devosia submarina]|uniref:hypothetical protein n=1 Tax=Devosia submarina TaxID=1173082 RepID=UPI001300BC80|nr:hypothetical protein [Devosia submarina]